MSINMANIILQKRGVVLLVKLFNSTACDLIIQKKSSCIKE